jgi:hypothetical protein
MKCLALLAALAACHEDSAPPAPPPPDPLLRTVPHPVPAGPYRVTYDCGPTARDQIDLRAHTRSTIANGSPAPAIANLSEPLAAMIGDTTTRVLAGGPYRAEPGACTLMIETADGAPVFTIEKAGHKEHDAVSELVRVFVP